MFYLFLGILSCIFCHSTSLDSHFISLEYVLKLFLKNWCFLKFSSPCMFNTYLFFPIFELQSKFERVSYSSRLKCCLWEVWFQIGNLVFVFFLEALGQCFYLGDFRTFMCASGCLILFHFSCLTLGEWAPSIISFKSFFISGKYFSVSFSIFFSHTTLPICCSFLVDA